MKKATIVFFVLLFGFFFLPGVSFACGGGHGDDGAGHEMMQPESGGEGHVCPCHEANAPDTAAPAPKPEAKTPPTARDMFQNVPKPGPNMGQSGHQCPHHK